MQRAAEKYTKFYNARAEPLFCSLSLLPRRRCRCRRGLLKVPIVYDTIDAQENLETSYTLLCLVKCNDLRSKKLKFIFYFLIVYYFNFVEFQVYARAYLRIRWLRSGPYPGHRLTIKIKQENSHKRLETVGHAKKIKQRKAKMETGRAKWRRLKSSKPDKNVGPTFVKVSDIFYSSEIIFVCCVAVILPIKD